MNKTLIFLLLTYIGLFSQEKVYFDANWEKTNKENASYYRILPFKQKEDKILIIDYYISGKKQMEGWANKDNENMMLGEVKWFYENGNIKSKRFYLYNHITGAYGIHNMATEYHKNGNIKSEIDYFIGGKTGKANFYDTKGKLISSCMYESNKIVDGTSCFSTYKNGSLVKKELYYKDTKQLAFKGTYTQNRKEEHFFDSNGKLLKEVRSMKNSSNPFTIEYYESEECGYVDGIKRIKNITPNQEYFYDKKGNLISKGIYKNSLEPFEGTFYQLDSQGNKNLYYLKTYQKGQLTNLKSYLNGKLFTDGDFIDGKPYSGSFLLPEGFYNFKGRTVYNMKKGLIEGKKVFYFRIEDIIANKPLGYYTYLKGKKEGISEVTLGKHTAQSQNYKVIYKADRPFEGTMLEGKGNEITYSKGKKVAFKKTIHFKDNAFFEIYRNGKKHSVEYPFLDTNNNNIPTGFFKNEKPYNGCFINKNTQKLTLDCYIKGIKEYSIKAKEEVVISIMR